MWKYFHMEIDDQNVSGLPGVQSGTPTPNARPLNTAMWLSSMDPISSQIMESLITSNVGPQALASSFNLFNFIFQNFENFATELNRNPIDESSKIKIERPTEPKERPNPNNAFEMIRTMRGHISAGMWALILYCKEGYLSVHLLPSDFIASIIDDKMSDFPAYLEIVQQEGQPASWQIENKPIVIEVIPGLIRHLVEHLVRVSRGEAPANERFSFFTPRKTKETSGVFTMPPSVQAAIAGEVLPDTSSSNGGGSPVPFAQATPPTPATFAPPQAAPQNNARLTRSQIIKNMMQEARLKADAASNQIFYNKPNQATLAQEKTVAVQQFSLPGAPELNFKNPGSSGTNIQATSPPPFLAPPAGLFGGGINAAGGFENAPKNALPGLASPPPSLLTNSGTDIQSIDTPSAFNSAPQSPFARPAAPPSLQTPPAQTPAPPANPSTSATSLAALLNSAPASTQAPAATAASTASQESISIPISPPAPPVAPVPPPPQPAPLSQSGVMAAPPPPPGQPPRPLPPPGVPTGFSAPPAPPFSAPPPPPSPNEKMGSVGAPPPLPSLAPPSPPPLPSMSAPPAPPPPPAPPSQQSAAVPLVPVVPFPQFTQTSMPAAPVPESLILGESAKSPLSLFDDDEEIQESLEEQPEVQEQDEQILENASVELEDEIVSSSEDVEPGILSESSESADLFDFEQVQESNEVFEPSEELQENSEVSYEQEEQEVQEVQEYEQSSEYENAPAYEEAQSGEDLQQYEQGEFEEQQNYDGETSYQEYALDESQQGEGEAEYEQYETDESYQMSGEVNGFAASIQDPLDSPEALNQIMEQSQRVVRDGCFQILGELDQVLDSLRAAAQVAMHNDNIQAVTDIMQHSKQIKALRERLVSFKEENIKEE